MDLSPGLALDLTTRTATEVGAPADVQRPVDVQVLVRRTSALLRAGVPLSLILDLADPQGPDSVGRFTLEGCDVGWLYPN